MPADHAKRCDRLFRALREHDLPNLLVTSPFNVTYLTGFTGEDSYLFAADGKITILSDARYEEQLQLECPNIPLFIRQAAVSMIQAAGEWLTAHRLRSVCVESQSTTLSQYETLRDTLSGANLTSSSGVVERLRERKDASEVEAIERAVTMAQRSFTSVTAMLTGDMTEKNVADELEFSIRKLGGAGSAFKSIVGVGPRAALPHGRPSSKRIGDDAFVLVDWGAKEDLYLCDLTRVVVTSKPSNKFRKIYQAVLDAQQAAILAIKPGAMMSDIDTVARTVIEQAGFGKRFTHSLGHSFGLQIHESIRLAKGQDRPLEPDMVVTVEPGIYIPGLAGVRIEDDVLVTKTGHRVLTSLPKSWDEITAR
ncbi:MAG: Xaa-Pro peptidase family protein [Pirellula sp.]